MAVNVHLEIGELVLDGVADPSDAPLVAAAFTAELTRLVRRDGVPAAARESREIDVLAGLPPLNRDASPERLGVTLARSVHAGLSGQARESREGSR